MSLTMRRRGDVWMVANIRRSQRAMERKQVTLQDVNTQPEGFFSGYLAVFGNKDQNGDVIEPGAFTKTLKEANDIKSSLDLPFLYPLLYMHDERKPVGGFTLMKEDAHGLYVEGMCDLDTELGRTVFFGMQKGYIGQLSIGYDPIKSNKDRAGVRHLTEVALWEGSAIVTGYAANPQAMILQTKSQRETQQHPAWERAQVAADRFSTTLDALVGPGVPAPKPTPPDDDEDEAELAAWRAGGDALFAAEEQKQRNAATAHATTDYLARRVASGAATLAERADYARRMG